MSFAEPSVEAQLAVLSQWRTEVERHIAVTDASLEALKLERNNALKWGIMMLGGALLGLIGFVASVLTGGHFTFKP